MPERRPLCQDCGIRPVDRSYVYLRGSNQCVSCRPSSLTPEDHARIKAEVATWPPLSQHQIAELRRLLPPLPCERGGWRGRHEPYEPLGSTPQCQHCGYAITRTGTGAWRRREPDQPTTEGAS